MGPRNYVYLITIIGTTLILSSAADDMLYGPRFVIQPMTQYVIYDSSGLVDTGAKFRCEVDANPQAEYQWWSKIIGRDASKLIATSGSELEVTPLILGKSQSQASQLDQEIRRTQFWCVASNTEGAIRSKPVRIRQYTLGNFTSSERLPLMARPYSWLKIPCFEPPHTSYPQDTLQYTWLKDGEQANRTLMTGEPRVFASRTGYLYFSSVLPQEDESNYTCLVKAPAPLTPFVSARYSPPTSVKIMSGYKRTHKPKMFPGFPAISPSRVRVGYNISIECLAYGSPVLEYKWVSNKLFGLKERYNITDNNRVLHIMDVRADDAGEYECHVSQGHLSIVRTANLIVHSPPTFRCAYNPQIAIEGSKIHLECATSVHLVTWFHNTHVISGGTTAAYTGREWKHAVILNNVTSSDAGMYQCQAVNQNGVDSGSIQLVVYDMTAAESGIVECRRIGHTALSQHGLTTAEACRLLEDEMHCLMELAKDNPVSGRMLGAPLFYTWIMTSLILQCNITNELSNMITPRPGCGLEELKTCLDLYNVDIYSNKWDKVMGLQTWAYLIENQNMNVENICGRILEGKSSVHDNDTHEVECLTELQKTCWEQDTAIGGLSIHIPLALSPYDQKYYKAVKSFCDTYTGRSTGGSRIKKKMLPDGEPRAQSNGTKQLFELAMMMLLLLESYLLK